MAEIQGAILVAMQEDDAPEGFVNQEWAGEMYDAYEQVKGAIKSLGRAEMYEASN